MEAQDSQPTAAAVPTSSPVTASKENGANLKDEGMKVPIAPSSVDAGMNGASNNDNGNDEAKNPPSAPEPTAVNKETNPTENAANVPVSASMVSKEGDDEDEDVDGGEAIEEGADVEDELFTNLERDQEKEDAAHAGDEQPKDVAAAPKLLQAAIEKGDVKMDDSESDEDAAKKKGATQEEEKKGEEDKGPGSPRHDHHHHARVRFSKYSHCRPKM